MTCKVSYKSHVSLLLHQFNLGHFIVTVIFHVPFIFLLCVVCNYSSWSFLAFLLAFLEAANPPLLLFLTSPYPNGVLFLLYT